MNTEEPIPAYEFKNFNAKANLNHLRTTNPLSDEGYLLKRTL